jgi:anti-sigma factor ChrR (cupin superfamily)
MGAVTRQADRGEKHDLPGNHSHVVRPAEMEWKKTRFPGCEVKGLLLDRQTGLVTALMRLAPGAVLPDHEHVKIEQTYMLEGKLVDKEGPMAGLSVGPGEFVWREARTRHLAWTPEGGLMLAMFQVPTSFSRRTAASPTYPAATGTAFGATCSRIRSRFQPTR